MKVLVTGSAGLIGSEAVRFYLDRGVEVIGIDNDMRKAFFGKEGSIEENIVKHSNYTHSDIDIAESMHIFSAFRPDVVIHAAAQPSHDWAAEFPLTDFKVNAAGTLKLLEATRRFCPDAVFIYVSTNKVYGDRPNQIPMDEYETRYDNVGLQGIDETMSIDNCMHSLFGVSKLAGDLLAQEYGRYFGLKTGIFRCGCITGAQHAGVELHGFLSYMAKCKKENKVYKIYGYGGKQVRDNIHAYDLITAFDHFIQNPRPGEVYNMGGGRHSNISVMEAIVKMRVTFNYIEQPRKGDHIWYISDVSKFRKDYPAWGYSYDMERIIENLMEK